MGLLSLTLPTIGQPNSTEDTDVRNALLSIQTLVNGNLDSANLAAAGIPFSKFTPRITWGAVNGTTGAVLVAGSGDWSAVRGSAGTYTVTFSPGYPSIPVIVVKGNVPSTATGIITAVTASSFTYSGYTV